MMQSTMELDEQKEREREIQDTIDGYADSETYILFQMAKYDTVDDFAQFLDYKNGEDMMEDFTANIKNETPDEQDYWDQLVIDYFA